MLKSATLLKALAYDLDNVLLISKNNGSIFNYTPLRRNTAIALKPILLIQIFFFNLYVYANK